MSVGYPNAMVVLLSMLAPIILLLIVNVACAIGAMQMAKSRGFNPVPAFFAGFFGSIIALLIIAMFPKGYAQPNDDRQPR